MTSEITTLIIQTIGSLFIVLVLLRLFLELGRADYFNPVSQAIQKITQPFTAPLRRVIPSIKSFDTASAVLAIIVCFIVAYATAALNGYTVPVLSVIIWSIVATIILALKILYWVVIAMVILSWFPFLHNNPVVAVIMQIGDAAIAPFRKVIPPIGMIDISAIFAFLLIHILEMVMYHVAIQVGLAPLLFSWL